MNKDKEIAAGKDVLSFCGKCKMPLAHTIISLTKKGTVDKCECKTCGAVHKYRDPDKPVKKRSGTKSGPKKEKISAEATWKEAIADAKDGARSYEMSEEFFEGNMIDHATFGVGVVEEVVNYNKIKVIFESGAKILIHNRES